MMSAAKSRSCSVRGRSIFRALSAWLVWLPILVNAAENGSADRLIQRFEARVLENPGDASAWRLLGKARERSGDYAGALTAFSESADLDPLSAAARFDQGRMYLETGQAQDAADSFAEAIHLAPDSSYAQQARELLESLPEPAGEIRLTGFEIRRFDGSDRVNTLLPQPERSNPTRTDSETLPPAWSLRLETGLLYNTNVALAPTSRDLSTGERASFQAFANPDFEWAVLNTLQWRVGPTFQGYFNLNEDHRRDFNLQSYQPGVFAERMFVGERAIVLPRLAYTWTHDAFDGSMFANRHAVTLSTTVVWPDLNESTVYWLTDNTDYADDGADPAVSSNDGWTNALGVSHRVYVDQPWLRSASAGLEGQRADTREQFSLQQRGTLRRCRDPRR
jgi:tetratricopeptide (TPR) repeat protein